MPLFICDCCGALDNTACGGKYHTRHSYANAEQLPDLCCKCNRGDWHNKFPYELCTAELYEEIGEDNFVYKIFGQEYEIKPACKTSFYKAKPHTPSDRSKMSKTQLKKIKRGYKKRRKQ
jgi:hypothetical protein